MKSSEIISKKSRVSVLAAAVTFLLCFAFMHLMSLFKVSKWLGVSIGGAVFAVMLVLTLTLNKKRGGSKKTARRIFVADIIINGAASGIALSSLFVYVKVFPQVWQSSAVAAAFIALTILYCLFTAVPFFRRHYVICIVIYSVLVAASAITAVAVTRRAAFLFAVMLLIPFISFLASLAIRAEDKYEHVKNISYCSFAALIVIVVAVLLIISEGDGFDLSGGDSYGGANKKNRFNPYDYYTESAAPPSAELP